MKDIIVKDIIRECNGILLCGDENIVCESFSKDTRTLNSGDVYLGIKGETFNGSLLYKEALDKGAKVCIVDDVDISSEDLKEYTDKAVIKVDNTVNALQKLAKYKRSLYDIPVIGVTGSVGKTSTKDIIASVLSKKYKVLKTEGNYNNEIGMPLTILKLKDHKAMVLEMGTDKFGDLTLLTNIARPTICVITIIGTSHIANFGSRENILKGKLEILQGLCENKVIVTNNDNDLLNKWLKENKEKYIKDGYNVYSYGINNASDYMAKNIDLNEFETTYTTNILENEYKVTVPVGGKHFVYNSLAVFAIGRCLNMDITDILAGIKEFKLTKMRMDISNLSNNVLVVNDTYNASYDSMKSGIEYLAGIKSENKLAILGDMLELGEYSEKLHSDVGKVVADCKIDKLITIGKEAKNIAKVAILNGIDKSDVYICNDLEEAKEVLENKIELKDIAILVKASRGMKLENIVEDIKEKVGN